MGKLVTRVVLGVAAGVAVYIGFSIWADAGRVASALARFHWLAAVLAGSLALGNYLVRFGRWQYYLRVLAIRIPARDSLQVFLAGFALTVTPGKAPPVVSVTVPAMAPGPTVLIADSCVCGAVDARSGRPTTGRCT